MAVQRLRRWCVLGGTGMLGQELQDALERAGETLAWAPTRDAFNLARPDWTALDGFDVVINAAALTDVDAAETNEDEYMVINGYAPNAIAMHCARRGIKFVQVSSDHAAYPVGAYGRSKLQGETVASRSPYGLVVRTAWLYSQHGDNFVKRILAAPGAITVHGAEQRGHPTWAQDVADWIVANVDRVGLVDVVSAGLATRAQWARAVLYEAGRGVPVRYAPATGAPRPDRAELSGVLGYWRDRLSVAMGGMLDSVYQSATRGVNHG